MPHWHVEEEKRLRDLLGSGTSLEKIAQLLDRSPDAVVLKVKRLGLRIPEAWRVKRKMTKGAFQALSWIRGLLSDVKTLKDVDNIRIQVDQALEQIKKAAAKNFQQALQPTDLTEFHAAKLRTEMM